MAQLMNIRVTNRESKALRLTQRQTSKAKSGWFCTKFEEHPGKAGESMDQSGNLFFWLCPQFHRWVWTSAPDRDFPTQAHLQVTASPESLSPSAPWIKVCCSWGLKLSFSAATVSSVSPRGQKGPHGWLRARRVGWVLLKLYLSGVNHFELFPCAPFFGKKDITYEYIQLNDAQSKIPDIEELLWTQ